MFNMKKFNSNFTGVCIFYDRQTSELKFSCAGLQIDLNMSRSRAASFAAALRVNVPRSKYVKLQFGQGMNLFIHNESDHYEIILFYEKSKIRLKLPNWERIQLAQILEDNLN